MATARNKDRERERLIKMFTSRTKGKRTPADVARGPRPGQGASATFSYSGRKPPPSSNAQSYVSQGRAVENVANQQATNAQHNREASERSQQYYRHKLGYDKPGITAKKAKRVARKAARKINPFD